MMRHQDHRSICEKWTLQAEIEDVVGSVGVDGAENITSPTQETKKV
jgi:hypothetical protein